MFIRELVGGIPTPVKTMSRMGLLFPTEWKAKKFHGSKPPTRNIIGKEWHSPGQHPSHQAGQPSRLPRFFGSTSPFRSRR